MYRAQRRSNLETRKNVEITRAATAGGTKKHDRRATKIGPAILVFLRGTKIPKRIVVARVVRP